eukprot:Gb_09891 [translate_table: standard]
MRKEIDPEEEPGFIERNPTWEEELPPIHPVDHDSIFQLDSPYTVPLVHAGVDQIFVPSSPTIELLPDSHALARKRWRTAYIGITRDLALKKQATRSSVGFGAQMKGKSCGIWEEYDRRRIAMFKLVFNQWNEYFLLAVTIVQCLAIIFKCTEKTSHRRSNILAVDIVDAVCTSIFTLDCALRIFCLGLIRGKTSYLRSHKWNILDFFTTIDSCLLLHTSQIGILSFALQHYAYSDS